MGKRAHTVETACPNCAHSPIPADADRCPACNVAFKVGGGILRHADREVIAQSGGTVIGGLDLLTSDAEAHPGTAAATLAAIGVYAAALGLGLLPGASDPNAYVLLACIEVALAIGLQSMPSFARPLVIVSAPMQCAAWLYLGRHALGSFATLGPAAAPLLVLASVTGATGPRRRSAILAAVLGIAAYAATAQHQRFAGPGPRLLAPAAQLSLQLPPGFEPLESGRELSRYLPLAGLDPRLQGYAFASPSRRVGGVWAVLGPGKSTPEHLAAAAARLIDRIDGDDSEARKVHDDLEALGAFRQVAYRIPFGEGRAASATAVQLPDDRVALLLLGAPAAQLESARQALAAGASFGSAARAGGEGSR